ncbi:hypothetical protein Tco_1317307 [Tanacetum coccineum]
MIRSRASRRGRRYEIHKHKKVFDSGPVTDAVTVSEVVVAATTVKVEVVHSIPEPAAVFGKIGLGLLFMHIIMTRRELFAKLRLHRKRMLPNQSSKLLPSADHFVKLLTKLVSYDQNTDLEVNGKYPRVVEAVRRKLWGALPQPLYDRQKGSIETNLEQLIPACLRILGRSSTKRADSVGSIPNNSYDTANVFKWLSLFLQSDRTNALRHKANFVMMEKDNDPLSVHTKVTSGPAEKPMISVNSQGQATKDVGMILGQ